ncbi:MAG: GNAT family protein [Bryobacteraceae bacterium]|jgi:ribosomal-protein-serine acetyltransferase
MSGTEARFPERIAVDSELELRQLEPADAEEIFAAVCANREHLGKWLPWVEGTETVEDTRRFLEQVAENRREGKTAAYSLRVGGVLAGLAGLHDIDPGNGTAQIGYWLTGAQEGRGRMTAAVQALIEVAFREAMLDRIEIRCAAGNVRSQAIPKRLGFTYEGTLRGAQRLHGERVDIRVYGLLREEWDRMRAASAEDVERGL